VDSKENIDNIPHIIFLGQNGFPSGLAEIQKLRLLAKSLVHVGCKVTIINRIWMLWRCPEDFEPKVNGIYDGINYIFACGTPYRPKTFFKRNFRRLYAYLREFYIVYRFYRYSSVDGAFVSVNLFWDVIRYRLISKLFAFPIVINIMEQRSAIVFSNNPFKRFDAWLFDRFVYHFVDGVITISEHLTSNVQRLAPNKPHLKVPILVDTSRYEGLKKYGKEKYILFCGGLVYLNIIQFILNSFELCSSENIFLYLVVNGPQSLMNELHRLISKNKKKEYIKVFSQLSDEELSKLYVNSEALLIPLKPTVQDKARFPHKIGEYCASGRPIVTTNYGEIRSYFSHKDTAFIAEEYDEVKYAKAIDEALSDPVLADKVGLNGKELCRREFDYLLYGEKIKEFIVSLKEKR